MFKIEGRSAVFAVEQVAHGFAAGGVGFALIFALVGIHGTLAAGFVFVGFAAFGTTVGEAGLTRFQFELLAADHAGFDGKRHN